MVGLLTDWHEHPKFATYSPLPNSRSANFTMANLGIYQHHLYCWATHSHKTLNVTAPENTRLGAVLVTCLLFGHSTMVLSSYLGSVGRRNEHAVTAVRIHTDSGPPRVAAMICVTYRKFLCNTTV